MSIPNYNDLTPGEQFIIKWQYNALGGFERTLIEAIMAADGGNLQRLWMGFPNEVSAFRNYSEVDGWWEKVKIKAGILPPKEEK